MDINAKIKLIAETMSGYTILVDSSNGANVELSKITMPCILVFIQETGEFASNNSHYRDSVNIRVAFLNKMPKGFKESDVEAMRYALKQDMVILYHKLKFDFQFKINNETVRYEIVYDEFDDNLIGVVFNDNIKERVGLNLACDVPDSHGELPSSPSFCQKVSECSSIVSINELIEGLQEQIDNLPTATPNIQQVLDENNQSTTGIWFENLTDSSKVFSVDTFLKKVKYLSKEVLTSIREFKQTSFTAEDGKLYFVRNNINISDPTGTLGAAYIVYVSAPGTVNIGGTNYATGDIIRRQWSGSWTSYLIKGNNTGDETYATIVSKLGYTPENPANKGVALGYPSLDGGGKIPASQLPSTVLELKGSWNALTNTPTLADGVGDAGDCYECTVAGSVNFGAGAITFAVGDWVVYGASNLWYKSVNSNEVTSVNGYFGTVVLKTDDIAEPVSTPTNLWFTNARSIASLLTAYAKSAGTISSSDSVLQAIQKLDGNNDLKLNIAAAATTGVSLTFTEDTVYGSIASPETGNITYSATGAKLGVTNIIIHNHTSAPTFGTNIKKLSGSGNYVTSVINYIYVTYINSTEVIYSINQRT